MKKKKFELSPNRIKTLSNVTSKKNHDSSARAKRKAKVILLRHEGKSIKDIMEETKLCKRTIISYVKEYNNPDPKIGGMRFIHKNEYKISSLNIFNNDGENVVLKEFRENPPSSYREASERIKNLFNITISESATRAYLNKKKIYTENSMKPIYDDSDLENENKNDRT